ncbi:MAG: DUF3667 domain-containing protein [Gammaproteobacteria bacterium]|nr:MAG: DUF3667 domain-containing protein [Gammaproteobacteria bacterium]
MHCANCGAERAGTYCSRCGQNDRDYHRSLPPLVSELLREAFELDSRLVRTLKLLLFKPGALAVEFSNNRRASYVSPIRLYLFVSILFFFFLSLGTDIGSGPDPERPQVQVQVDEVKDADPGALLSLLDETRAERAEEILSRSDNSIARLILLQIAKDLTTAGQAPDPAVAFLLGEAVDALYEPGNVVRQFMDNLGVGMLVMLPVYALLLKLFYPFRGRYYVENLVFSTHLHTFIYIAFMAEMLLAMPTGLAWLDSGLDMAGSALTIWIFVYHYLALRRYFGGGWLATLFKFGGLLSLYFVLLMATAFLLVLAVIVIQV